MQLFLPLASDFSPYSNNYYFYWYHWRWWCRHSLPFLMTLVSLSLVFYAFQRSSFLGFFFLLILYLSFLILWLFFVHVFYSRPFLRFYIPAFFTLFLPFFIHSPGCSIHFILCFCLLFLLNCFYFKLFTILFLSFCTYHSCGFYVLLRHSFLYSGVLLSPFA